MRSPDIGGAIGPDVFIGRPEGHSIGWIEHYCAVITYPKRYEEKAETRSGGVGRENPSRLSSSFSPFVLVPTHIDKYSVLDDSIQVKPRLPSWSSSTDGIWTATPGP